jgi:tetratricopeptide (TPR) repeat protein
MQMPKSELNMADDPFPCEALELAVASMRNGEEAVVAAHDPTFAFGAAGLPGIVPPDAVVSYRVTLHDFKDGPADYELEAADKAARAASLKDRGNAFFKKGALRRARRLYEKAEAAARPAGAADAGGDAELAALQQSIALNLAAVSLKEGRPREAIVNCNKVCSLSSWRKAQLLLPHESRQCADEDDSELLKAGKLNLTGQSCQQL